LAAAAVSRLDPVQRLTVVAPGRAYSSQATRIAGGAFSFAKAGVYPFTTMPGDFFMPNLETVGRDNILRLTVRVTA
jgi:hypothetical protein